MDDDLDEFTRDYYSAYHLKRAQDEHLEAKWVGHKAYQSFRGTQSLKGVLKHPHQIATNRIFAREWYRDVHRDYDRDPGRTMRMFVDRSKVRASYSRAAQVRKRALLSRPREEVEAMIKATEGKALETQEGVTALDHDYEQARQAQPYYVDRDPVLHYLRGVVLDYDDFLGQQLVHDIQVEEEDQWQ